MQLVEHWAASMVAMLVVLMVSHLVEQMGALRVVKLAVDWVDMTVGMLVDLWVVYLVAQMVVVLAVSMVVHLAV